jgi:hypothetical protein
MAEGEKQANFALLELGVEFSQAIAALSLNAVDLSLGAQPEGQERLTPSQDEGIEGRGNEFEGRLGAGHCFVRNANVFINKQLLSLLWQIFKDYLIKFSN